MKATDVLAGHQLHCAAGNPRTFELLVPTAEDFAAAARYLEVPKTGLRAGDALHLAIAANHGAARILTLDQGFLGAGKLLKLPVTRGIKA